MKNAVAVLLSWKDKDLSEPEISVKRATTISR